MLSNVEGDSQQTPLHGESAIDGASRDRPVGDGDEGGSSGKLGLTTPLGWRSALNCDSACVLKCNYDSIDSSIPSLA